MPEQGRGVSSRIAGRGALLRSVRGLLRRVGRSAVHRAATLEEQQWTARFYDDLEAALTAGLASDVARSSLVAYAARRAWSVKTNRTPATGTHA